MPYPSAATRRPAHAVVKSWLCPASTSSFGHLPGSKCCNLFKLRTCDIGESSKVVQCGEPYPRFPKLAEGLPKVLAKQSTVHGLAAFQAVRECG